MTGKIHVLPEAIANKIAAGEVVDRPASIVKELVENALDAGATAIEIAIKNGGKSLIRVSDNGHGIGSKEVELAFKRHATSKISSVEDLERIGSFGFRGEALPSIAAVSRVRLVTCAEGESVGSEIVIEGGKVMSFEESPPRKGTLIEVRDLFFNIPARRKFLKADTTETGHIVDVVSNLALSRLGVRFSLESSGKNLLDLLPSADLKTRAVAVMGPETGKHLLEIEEKVNVDGHTMKISGLIGKPYLARANRTGQIFFVNHRWVKSPGLGFSLQEGYHGLLMHGQFPVAVVFVEVDLEKVDVNVHPTKQEVKISNESEVKSLLKKMVRERLQKEGDLAPKLRTSFAPSALIGKEPSAFYPFKERSEESPLRVAEKPVEVTFGSSPLGAVEEGLTLLNPILLRNKLKITKVLGQIHHTFVIAETEEGFIVIDQHAAHERVMFEALLKNLRSEEPERQGLLMNEILELHPRQREIFEHALPFLAKVGFEIEPFGENAFVIRAYPAILKDENLVTLLRNFTEEKEEGKLSTELDHQAEEVAALIACKKKSVKAYDSLSLPAIEVLLERLARCDNPFNCPHGRPTFFKQTFLDLERQFKRK